jgi:integrase
VNQLVDLLAAVVVVPKTEQRAERRLSGSTQAKHLRVLHGCFTSAIRHGYAARNPVGELPPSEKPRRSKKEAAYFSNEEIPRLFAEFSPGVYRVLFETALKTGMRQGELLALTWDAVDLQDAVIHVRRSYTSGYLSTPKNHEKREVDITPDVVDLLGAWWGECGGPTDDKLVFPGESGGYLFAQTILRRELYPAMERAGIPRKGTFRGAAPDERRVFHSFRHTFAKLAIENGTQLTSLQEQMGHSSLAVTVGIYGHFEGEARKREMAKLAGAFSNLVPSVCVPNEYELAPAGPNSSDGTLVGKP